MICVPFLQQDFTALKSNKSVKKPLNYIKINITKLNSNSPLTLLGTSLKEALSSIFFKNSILSQTFRLLLV
jgi:hypothetical protein